MLWVSMNISQAERICTENMMKGIDGNEVRDLSETLALATIIIDYGNKCLHKMETLELCFKSKVFWHDLRKSFFENFGHKMLNAKEFSQKRYNIFQLRAGFKNTDNVGIFS
ncbi:CLUMA_CG009791, isoform A [Clunio marinus]|uniref:CLUMA_CG009791, isoform A n=1 Tax=Clunio marinus TaxID=568069 RepID=A0A1J1IBL4_9DIPT|nr:CLUMA_CG009791, isoform A [Clunio marinus]